MSNNEVPLLRRNHLTLKPTVSPVGSCNVAVFWSRLQYKQTFCFFLGGGGKEGRDLITEHILVARRGWPNAIPANFGLKFRE